MSNQTPRANSEDFMTVLRCATPGKIATKTHTLLADDTIETKKCDKELVFHFNEAPVSSIYDVHDLLATLEKEPRKLVIRGKPIKEPGAAVFRRMKDPGAAFVSTPRYWVMFDFDKIPYPAYMNPAQNPEDAVKWATGLLPECFNDITCVYQFSSGQNIPKKLGDPAPETLSLHLWFYCDRKIDEQGWKRYLSSLTSCPVDLNIYTAVHQLYTAAPILEGIDNPFSKRLGIIKGISDVVSMPPIPEAPQKMARKIQQKDLAAVPDDNRKKLLEILKDNYPNEGERGDFCAALAGTWRRNGGQAEEIAEFILEAAEAAGDEESDQRHDSALRICGAVDNNERAQGIPTLKKHLDVAVLNQVLELLGIGTNEPEALIQKLNNQSTPEEIEKVLEKLADLPAAEKKIYASKIAKATGNDKGDINAMQKDVARRALSPTSIDPALSLVKELLFVHFNNGKHLIHYRDGAFWRYTGKFWKRVQDEYLIKLCTPLAEEIVNQYLGHKDLTVDSLVSAAMRLLHGEVHTEEDVLRLQDEPRPVINCNNGELWFNPDSSVELRPFKAESYLTQCGSVNYDPAAKCPKFITAYEQIFSKSSNPKEMVRHLGEIIGYAIQPCRPIPVFFMFIGKGQDGKSTTMKIIQRLTGDDAIFSGRIAELEKNRFSLGQLAGKRIFCDDDVDVDQLLPDGTLKKISEQKVLTGELKHGNFFNFRCCCLPILLSNSAPATRDLSWGMRRRAKVVPFNHQFLGEEDNKGLFDRIWEEESAGILNFAVEGYKRLIKRGDFDDPDDCKEATEAWLVKSNALVSFLNECCIFQAKKWIHVRQLFEDYQHYTQECGFRNTLTRPGFQSRLESLGYDIGIRKGYKAVLGITTTVLKDTNDDEKFPDQVTDVELLFEDDLM